MHVTTVRHKRQRQAMKNRRQRQRQRQRCSSPSLNLIKPHPKRAVCKRPMTGPVFNTFSSAEKFHCRTYRRSLWPQCHAAELRFWRRVAGFCGNFQFCEDWWSSVGRMEVGQTDQTGAVKKSDLLAKLTANEFQKSKCGGDLIKTSLQNDWCGDFW